MPKNTKASSRCAWARKVSSAEKYQIQLEKYQPSCKLRRENFPSAEKYLVFFGTGELPSVKKYQIGSIFRHWASSAKKDHFSVKKYQVSKKAPKIGPQIAVNGQQEAQAQPAGAL